MSGGSNRSQSQSQQEVWEPWGDAASPLLEQAQDFYNPAIAQINNPQLQQDLQQWNAGIKGTASDLYQQQSEGGNLAGYDIANSLANSMGATTRINVDDHNAVGYDPNNYQAATYGTTGVPHARQVGDVNQSHAYDQYMAASGGDGGVGQMNNMFRSQAGLAASDMLSAVDARAAASGMSGGSRHGTAVGRGFEGINQNLQSNMAQTGYDAYNRNIEHLVGIGSGVDSMNNQRELSNQAAVNQFRGQDYAAKNQARAANAGAINQARATNAGAANQANAANAGAMNQAGLANQGMQFQGQQTNLQTQLQQQQQLQQLLNMQNSTQGQALSNTGAMMGLGQTGYQEALSPYSAYAQLLQGLGGSTVLSNSSGSSSGRNGGVL